MRLTARFRTTAAALAVAVALSAATAPSAALAREGDDTTGVIPIPGQYLVSLEPGFDTKPVLDKIGATALFTYAHVVNGFTAKLDGNQVNMLRLTPGVQSVEQDATGAFVFEPDDHAPSTGDNQARAVGSWGLDRVNQRDLPLDGSGAATGDGASVTAYIVDTGIDFNHTEFGGRAKPGYDAMGDGRNGADCHGHGTHVAGTVAGSTYGLARKANLVSVRVLGCDARGSWSGIVAGLDWIAGNAVKPAVANLSLGGTPASSTVDQAANKLADSGVFVAAAAGNDTADACGYSPARAARVFTIGATTNTDGYAGYSNRGPCVQLLAPGSGIVSAKLGGGSATLNGTSMAAPHVAGAAALYKQRFGDKPQGEIMTYLWDNATPDKITGQPANTPNRLLFTGGL